MRQSSSSSSDNGIVRLFFRQSTNSVPTSIRSSRSSTCWYSADRTQSPILCSSLARTSTISTSASSSERHYSLLRIGTENACAFTVDSRRSHRSYGTYPSAVSNAGCPTSLTDPRREQVGDSFSAWAALLRALLMRYFQVSIR
jgi:hypothetical protein